jgi:hypothetical protein
LEPIKAKSIAEVAAKINPKRQIPRGGFSFDQEIPFIDIVTKKATKKYESQGAPVELILHFDLRLGSEGVVQRQIEKHVGALKSLFATGPSLVSGSLMFGRRVSCGLLDNHDFRNPKH